jgi:hypothetical protein
MKKIKVARGTCMNDSCLLTNTCSRYVPAPFVTKQTKTFKHPDDNCFRPIFKK